MFYFCKFGGMRLFKGLLKKIWWLEFLLALLIIAGVMDGLAGLISIFFLCYGIWRLSNVNALRLYIYSIPIFVVLPDNSLSSSMSIWRFVLLFFVFKIIVRKFELGKIWQDRATSLADKKNQLQKRLLGFKQEIIAANYYTLLLAAGSFVFVCFLSLLVAQSPTAGLKKIIFLVSLFSLFGVVRYAIRNQGDAVKILRALFVSLSSIVLVGQAQFIVTFFVRLYDFWHGWNNHVINAFYGEQMRNLLSYSNTWFSYYGSMEIPPTLRMFSVMPDSHSFAIIVILTMPLTLYYAFNQRVKNNQFKYGVWFVMLMLSIWFSGSRGAWMGWVVALAASLYLFFYPKFPSAMQFFRSYQNDRKIYRRLVGAMLLFIVLFPVSGFLLQETQKAQIRLDNNLRLGDDALLRRAFSISDPDETSNKGRLEIWKYSAESVLAHPILGIGVGNFPFALEEKITAAKKGASAHNLYLDILVETGIFGLAAFLMMIWQILRKFLKLSQDLISPKWRVLTLGYLIALIWIFAYGFVDVVIFNDKVLTFLVIIVSVVYAQEHLGNKKSALELKNAVHQ